MEEKEGRNAQGSGKWGRAVRKSRRRRDKRRDMRKRGRREVKRELIQTVRPSKGFIGHNSS